MPGFLRLSRPVNCVMSAVGVAIGGIVAVGPAAWGGAPAPLAYAVAAAALFTAGGNALNDIFDVETDRVNHPDRPLVTGALSPSSARRFAFGMFVAAEVLAALANFWALGVVFLNAALMYAYESGLKRRGVPGNVVIAYLVGSLFLFAGVAVYRGDSTPLVRTSVLAVLAFLTTLGREVTKDIEDMAGGGARRPPPGRGVRPGHPRGGRAGPRRGGPAAAGPSSGARPPRRLAPRTALRRASRLKRLR